MTDGGIKVELGIPEHGWMRLVVSYTEQVFHSDVSDALSDSLGDLVSAVLKLAKGIDDLTVTLFEEPSICDVYFRRIGQFVDLAITRYPDGTRVSNSGNVEFVYHGGFAELCTAFWRAFRKLESKADEWNLERVWSYPFPSEVLQKLTDQLKMIKS
jgi:hypothetical protein